MNLTLWIESSFGEPPKNILDFIIACLSISVIIIGVVGNTICFLIFGLNKEMRKISTSIYLAHCSITDTVSLFVWNLNHFLTPFFNTGVERETLFRCRFFSFIQYHSLQSSAWLLSFMCVDRFFSVISVPGSTVSKLPFSTPKSAHVWSILILLVLFFVDLHVLILNGYFNPPVVVNSTILEQINGTTINKTVSQIYQDPENHCYAYSPTFSLLDFWEKVHLYIYSFVPFVVMLVFNVLLIARIVRHKSFSKSKSKSTPRDQQRSGKNRITISLIFITLLFILMTFPASVLFGYVYFDQKSVIFTIFKFFDWVSFLNRASLFVNCFITNLKFRSIFFSAFKKRRVSPLNYP